MFDVQYDVGGAKKCRGNRQFQDYWGRIFQLIKNIWLRKHLLRIYCSTTRQLPMLTGYINNVYFGALLTTLAKFGLRLLQMSKKAWPRLNPTINLLIRTIQTCGLLSGRPFYNSSILNWNLIKSVWQIKNFFLWHNQSWTRQKGVIKNTDFW